jgi:hypothetical protein
LGRFGTPGDVIGERKSASQTACGVVGRSRLRWQLDVTFGEDASRIGSRRGGENSGFLLFFSGFLDLSHRLLESC